MAFLNNDVYDNGLNQLLTCDEIWICSQQPADYNEATTLHNDTSGQYGLGFYEVQTGDIVGPQNIGAEGEGRRIVVNAIEGGLVQHGLGSNNSQSATHWAMVDTANNRLLATQELNFPQVVTHENLFNLATFSISFPAPSGE